MRIGSRFFDRWENDYDYKTLAAALGSLTVTVAFALFNGFLGLYHASWWYGTICVYYIILVILRGIILAAEKRIASGSVPEESRKKVYLTASALLLLLNISLTGPMTLMVRLQKPVSMTLVPAITMATYTTYKVIMASVNLKKRKASSNDLVKLLRTISFIDALVSVLTLQNTLIMVQSNGADLGMLPLTAATSAAVLLAILLLSVAALIRSVGSFKSHPEEGGGQ